MSVRLMGAVFDLKIPSTEKLVLLAMADHARDDGTGCYPAIGTLAKKTSLSRRGTQKLIRRLQMAGFVVDTGKVSRLGTVEYTLSLNRGGEQGSLVFSGSGRTPGQKGGERQCAKGANQETQSSEPGSPESLEPSEENRQAAPDRSRQDTRSGAGPQVGSERQLTHELKTLARDKSLPRNGWPSEPVRADLFGGLHSGSEGMTGMHAIARRFFDSRCLPFMQQLGECVSAAVTALVLARNAKLGALDPGDIEKRARGKLSAAGETLRTFELVRDFDKRSRLVTQHIARVVTESAAEIFEATERLGAICERGAR